MPFDEGFESPGQFEFGFLVHDVSRLRRTVFDNALKPLDITRSQWWVLVHLSRHQPTTSADLAKILDIGGVALGDLLERLERKNYVIRKRIPGDRRVRQVEMTREGKALLHEMQARTVDLNSAMLAGMGEDELTRVEDILHRMKLRLQEMNLEAKADKEK